MNLPSFVISTNRQWDDFFISGSLKQILSSNPPLSLERLYTPFNPSISNLTIIFETPGYKQGDTSPIYENFVVSSSIVDYLRPIDIYSAIYNYYTANIDVSLFTLFKCVLIDDLTIMVNIKINNSSEMIQTIDGYTIQLFDVIGKGTSGQVYNGQIIATYNENGLSVGTEVAVKKQKRKKSRLTEAIIFKTLNDLGLSCGFIGYNVDEFNGNIYIAMTLCKGGDLNTRIKEISELPNNTQVELFTNILNIMKGLDDNGYVHGDIKPQNFMMCSEDLIPDHVCLTDFGSTYNVSEGSERFTGSPNYISPALWISGRNNSNSDKWALGIMLLKMILNDDWVKIKSLRRSKFKKALSYAAVSLYLKLRSGSTQNAVGSRGGGNSLVTLDDIKQEYYSLVESYTPSTRLYKLSNQLVDEINKSTDITSNKILNFPDPRIRDLIISLLEIYPDMSISYDQALDILAS